MSVPSIIETAVVGGCQLSVEFQRRGNQFAQTVLLIRPHHAFALLISPNAAEGVAWPSSPPWQELHEHEDVGGDKVLMLVGRAGASHWSMAVSVDHSQSAIVFDVACRVRSQPDFLGTTYQLPGAVARPQQIVQEAVELLPAGDAALAIVLETLAVAGERAPLVELRGGQVVVQANVEAQPPATIRWKYRVRFAD